MGKNFLKLTTLIAPFKANLVALFYVIFFGSFQAVAF